MPLLPRKGVLAIAAVIDVAIQAQGQPVSAKTLAARHGLPPRHLEPVLQALVRYGILKGIRGPRGGYELARDRRRVTANDILRAAGTVEDAEVSHAGSDLLTKVVLPAMTGAEQEFGIALGADQSRRPGARCAGAQAGRQSRLRQLNASNHTRVHDLDSYGAIPLESKVDRFAGSPRDGSLAVSRVPASRGEGACRTRSGGAAVRGIGGARKE